jgi:hypothetical protein
MKFLLLVLSISLLTACTPMPMPADGLDAATDAVAVTDAGPEASSDALRPHVDGGGID